MTTSELQVAVRERDGIAVIDLTGDVNSSADRALNEAYAQAAGTGADAVALNFEDATYINSTGIALIVRSWQTLDGDGNERFALCGVGHQVKRVLDITGLEKTIPTHSSREQALERLRS